MPEYATLKNLPALFFNQAEQFGGVPFLWTKQKGAWQSLSWQEVAASVSAVARGLRSLDIKPGDRVILLSENRPEWLIADLAIMTAGAITTPAYTTNTTADHQHILSDSGAVIAIVSSSKLLKSFLPAAVRAGLETIIIMDDSIDSSSSQGISLRQWSDVLTIGQERRDDMRKLVNDLQRSDTCCIIYTSGTGGAPKGVMLSHGAILSNCEGAEDVLKHLPGYGKKPEVFLSFLPLSHSYEHTAGQFVPIAFGAQIYYAESVDKLMDNMAEVRPTIMISVPRLYETVRGRIMTGLSHAKSLRKRLFFATVQLGRKRYEAPDSLTFMERLQDWLLDKLVRAKVQARFGGRLKAFVSGGGPLNYDVGIFFTALGLRILQGYGQTESGPVSNVNRCELNKLDTVGPPMKGVELRIAEDGEILLRGELVMNGYWRQPERTAETIIDGWLHTGDIGELDTDGYLRITERKKDIIVNSGGDNISPQRVEGVLCLEPEIAQCMVYGDRHPHLVAVIVPDQDFVQQWLKEQELLAETPLANNADFREIIQEAVNRANRKLSVLEKTRNFLIREEPFSVENEMLTPSMKIRRHVITAAHREKLEALYSSSHREN